MDAETTTKFKGDIVFNDGEKDILVSDLATVEEVNEALNQCIKNNDSSITLDNENTTTNRKFVIHPSGQTSFVFSIITPTAEKQIMKLTAGNIDFGYNQVSLENIYIGGRSIQTLIRNDDPDTILATDLSIYSAAAVNKKIEESKPVIDHVLDAFSPTEPSSNSPMFPNNDFVYDDSHVLSSRTSKALVDEVMKRIESLEVRIESLENKVIQ